MLGLMSNISFLKELKFAYRIIRVNAKTTTKTNVIG